MTDKNQISRCPCCGSMLRIDWGEPDFSGVKNIIGTCSFRAVDVRDLERARHDLAATIDVLTWITSRRPSDNSIDIEQLRRRASLVLKKINKKG